MEETQETQVEETPTTETPVEEPVEQVEDTPEPTEPMTIEELLALNEEDYEEFTDDANHTGMKPLHEWMQHIPEDVRKHVANLRASYTRKTQEIAEMRKQLEAEREALLQQQELTLNNPYLQEAQQAYHRRRARLVFSRRYASRD
jgi:DNA repair exonuclease SbcCD ATPase subunit